MRQDKDGKAILKSSILSLLDTDLCVSLNIKTNASKGSELKLRLNYKGHGSNLVLYPNMGLGSREEGPVRNEEERLLGK